MITKYVRIIQINPSLLYLQETIAKKFHHRALHQNHNKKNRDRSRMYVSIFCTIKKALSHPKAGISLLGTSIGQPDCSLSFQPSYSTNIWFCLFHIQDPGPQEDVTDNVGHNTEDSEHNDATEAPAPPTPPPGPSATTVAYNFVTSFFTSLFPNGPGIQNWYIKEPLVRIGILLVV